MGVEFRYEIESQVLAKIIYNFFFFKFVKRIYIASKG